jgi:hypothetical protein
LHKIHKQQLRGVSPPPSHPQAAALTHRRGRGWRKGCRPRWRPASPHPAWFWSRGQGRRWPSDMVHTKIRIQRKIFKSDCLAANGHEYIAYRWSATDSTGIVAAWAVCLSHMKDHVRKR